MNKMAFKSVFILLLLLISISFVSAKTYLPDPCAGDTTITEDGTNFYMDSACFDITFPKNYVSNIDFYDKFNDDNFDLKLMSIIDVNNANQNQKQTTPFSSMGLTASKTTDSIEYISSDGKFKLIYLIANGKIKANMEIHNWVSNYAIGQLRLSTRIHKEDTASSHFQNLPAIVDGIEQPLIYENKDVGVNKFIEQTMFIGNSFTYLEIDPLYVVNITPEPSEWLIQGDFNTTGDLEFVDRFNVSENMSDNSDSSTIYTMPEQILFPLTMVESLSESTTTSVTYVDKLNDNITITEDGTYMILATSELHYDATDRMLYCQVQWDGQVISEQQWVPKDGVIANNYEPCISHTVKTLTVGTYNTKIQYKVEDSGDIGYMRNARVSVMKLREYYTTYDNTSYNVGTGWTPLISLLFTPDETKNYFIIATGEYMIDDKDESIYTLFSIDGLAIDDLNFEPMRDDRNDYRPSYYFSVNNLDNTQHNITISGKEDTNTVSTHRNNRVTVFALEDVVFVDSDDEYFTTSTSYVNVSNLTVDVTIDGDYMFYAYGQYDSRSLTQHIGVSLYIDDVEYCEHLFENKELVSDRDDMPFSCQAKVNLSVGTHYANIRFKSLEGAVPVYITNTRLVSMPVNLLDFEQHAKSVNAKFPVEYNSTYNYYLTLKKTSSDSSNVNILAYQDDENVSNQGLVSPTFSLGTYIYNVTSLMEYMLTNTSLGYSAFRITTDDLTYFSEIRLLEITDDILNPAVTQCNINTTVIGCDSGFEFSCLVTDDIGVGDVEFQINDINYTPSQSIFNYSYILNVFGVANTTYDFQNVFAYDLVNNLNQTDPNLQGQYYCCLEDWQVQYTSCEINDTQIKTYYDSNGCVNDVDVVPVPVDNGSETFCNFCSDEIHVHVDSECYWNGTAGVEDITYHDHNFLSCCVLTGLATDCTILMPPYNYTSPVQNCTLLQEDFEIELELEMYFGFGIGGIASDKVFGKIFINDTNNTYECITYVTRLDNGQIVQTNPPYTKRTTSTIAFVPKEIEDREFFTTRNGLSNVYWTDNNLIVDGRQYKFSVECSGGGNHLKAEKFATVLYENVNAPITRWVWITQNVTGIFFFVILLIIVVGAIGLIVRELRQRRGYR